MIYELINPSDMITFEGDDDQVAAVAVLFLGKGKAGLVRFDDEGDGEGVMVLPVFLFAQEEHLIAWCGERHLGDLGAFVASHRARIGAFLSTVLYGDARDRRAFGAIIEGRSHAEQLEARRKWNDAKRSSLNDWGSYALQLAEQLRGAA